MALINSSYFIGRRNVPNINAPENLSLINHLIKVHEKEYLQKLLGYELFTLFTAGILQSTPDQRYLDILLGVEFTGVDGLKKRWPGLVSVTSSQPSVNVSISSDADIIFTVGVTPGAPAAGATSYSNANLAGKTYRVFQRGYGWLEPLKQDNSNSLQADITINPVGGFAFRNGISFPGGDKFFITFDAGSLNVSNVPVVPEPDSPIADFVYYHWLKHNHTVVTGIGNVKAEAQNSTRVTEKYKACQAWNDMVDKSNLLYEYLYVNTATYPEYELYMTSRDIRFLLTKIHPYY